MRNLWDSGASPEVSDLEEGGGLIPGPTIRAQRWIMASLLIGKYLGNPMREKRVLVIRWKRSKGMTNIKSWKASQRKDRQNTEGVRKEKDETGKKGGGKDNKTRAQRLSGSVEVRLMAGPHLKKRSSFPVGE